VIIWKFSYIYFESSRLKKIKDLIKVVFVHLSVSVIKQLGKRFLILVGLFH